MVLPQAAWGGIITVPRPDLLGTYECPGFWSFDSKQTVYINLPVDFVSARLIVRGVLTPGLVRGDGITRAAQEAVLMGSWAFCLQNPGGSYGGPIWDIVSGPFTFQIDYFGPGPCYMPSPDNPPTVFSLSLGPVVSVYLVPWLLEQPDPIYDFDRWDDGLVMVTPLTATVTEAYWEVVVPEPATLSLLALGGLAILGRGRSNRR